jgi:hypothetical protein
MSQADRWRAAQTFDYNGEVLLIPEAVAPLFKGCTIGGLALSSNIVYGPLTVRSSLPAPIGPLAPLLRL